MRLARQNKKMNGTRITCKNEEGMTERNLQKVKGESRKLRKLALKYIIYIRELVLKIK